MGVTPSRGRRARRRTALAAAGNNAPGNRITLGLIGAGGRGVGVMKDFMAHEGVQVLAVCDVDKAHLDPVVAAVNGVGVGIGLTMLLHCDIVLMSDTARLKVPFISLGVTTEASASLMMPTVMGWQRAAEVLYTEPWIDAEQLYNILVNDPAVTRGDSAHSQFRTPGNAELANDQDIERYIERSCNLIAYWHSPPRQRQDKDIRAPCVVH